MVGMRGFEPRTSCSQSRRAAKLRHIPVFFALNCCFALIRFRITPALGLRQRIFIAIAFTIAPTRPETWVAEPRKGTSIDSVTVESVGDFATYIPSFERFLRVAKKSKKAIATYSEAANQLLAFLQESGMPTEVAQDWQGACGVVQRVH
jgi:hypothetical protein